MELNADYPYPSCSLCSLADANQVRSLSCHPAIPSDQACGATSHDSIASPSQINEIQCLSIPCDLCSSLAW